MEAAEPDSKAVENKIMYRNFRRMTPIGKTLAILIALILKEVARKRAEDDITY